jgi:hypothetical protein
MAAMNSLSAHAHRLELLGLAAILLIAGSLGACSDEKSPTAPEGPPRTYRMGFSGIPPRSDFDLLLAAIDLWSLRADAAIMSYEVPWDSLLAGVPVGDLVQKQQVGLAEYYRAKGLQIWVYLDPGNGLNRAGESTALVNAGRSITEPEIQAMYRRYAAVVDSLVQPEHFGLALETNLIRGIAPANLYAAVRQVANDTAADLRARNTTAKLSVSVQVDYAWGRLGNSTGLGIDQDLVDFPFIDELGLSSYPYLAGFDAPEEIPDNYYSGLVAGHDIPVAVTEGGWASNTQAEWTSSQAEQRRYLVRQDQLLDNAGAIGVFQLTFTDLDLAAITPPPPSTLSYFSHLGLVDIDLNPKLALAAWDSTFARPLE